MKKLYETKVLFISDEPLADMTVEQMLLLYEKEKALMFRTDEETLYLPDQSE